MTAGALKRACHHVCKQPRSAPLNPQTWLYGVSSRMGGERRAGCQERAGAGVAQSGGCHIRGQHMMAPHLEGHWGHHPQSCIILPPVCSVGIPATVIRFSNELNPHEHT